MNIRLIFRILFGIFLAIGFYLVFVQHEENPKPITLSVEQEVLLFERTPFLNKTGQVAEIGWSKTYIKEFNCQRMSPVWLGLDFLTEFRYKRYDYYSYLFDNYLVQFVVSNAGYGSWGWFHIYDFKTHVFRKFEGRMMPLIDTPFPQLSPNPFNCTAVDYTFKKGGFEINVKQSLNITQNTCKSVASFKSDSVLEGKIKSKRSLSQEDVYDVNAVDDNNRYFSYNLKTYENKCYGFIRVENSTTSISQKDCMSMTDMGRAIFEYKTNWVWVSSYGKDARGSNLSFNFAGGVFNNQRTLEDFFKLKGKVTKLNPVEIPFDRENLMKILVIRTAKGFDTTSNYADIVFTPTNVSDVSQYFLIGSTQLTYVYGTFSGLFIDGNGGVIEFNDIQGVLELGKFKW